MVALGGVAVSHERGTPVAPWTYRLGCALHPQEVTLHTCGPRVIRKLFGDTTPRRMAGVTLLSRVRFKEIWVRSWVSARHLLAW